MKYYRKDNSVIELPDEESKPSGYKEITEEQYNTFMSICGQLAELRFELKKTDYKCLKHMDGEMTDEEYEPIKQARHNLRIQINELEAQL